MNYSFVCGVVSANKSTILTMCKNLVNIDNYVQYIIPDNDNNNYIADLCFYYTIILSLFLVYSFNMERLL